MSDTITPGAQSEQRLDATGSPTFSAKQTHPHSINNHDTKHLLTKGLITTKGWTLAELVKKAPNFHPVHRVHFKNPSLMQIIRMHEDSGIPLIVEGFHEHESWPTELFTLDWLNEHGKPGAFARNVRNWSDFELPLSELIRKLRATQIYASENETERLYGKDAECPHEWSTWLSTSNVLPSDLLPHGTHDYLNYLPSDVQTLMCYLGVGDTFTPFHKDLCASSGQNLMCYTENGGSSFWFMTKSSAAPHMAKFFHEMDQELDFETHVVTLEELRRSRLDIYIAEQQLGDLVLVPPRSCHQVINNGGITMKTSWSRMTLKGLTHSLYHELPVYHRVCRPETYKVKLNIYRALHRQTRTLQKLPEQQTCSTHSDLSSSGIESRAEQVAHELHRLLDLLDDVLGEEYFSKYQAMPHVSLSDTSHRDNITCDFCAADIFQSFFECMSCASQSPTVHQEMKIGDGIVVCPLCYIEGRSCKCGAMKPTQCRPFDDLLTTRDDALHAIRVVCADAVKDYRSLLDHPNAITSARHVGVFRAACMLYERRLRLLDTTRMCSSKEKNAAHEVPHSSQIYCKPCHNGRCLTHVLEVCSTHSSMAILISEGAERGPSDWHEYHKKSKKEFKEARAGILLDEETGARPNSLMKLTYVASRFRICKSVNPNATLPGWYDNCLELRGTSSLPSPSKYATNPSGSDVHQGSGPMMYNTPGKFSLTAEILFGRSESVSDLTSLPSDYQDSPSSTRLTSASSVLEPLSTAGQLPGSLGKGKNRKIVMDYVSLPHLQPDRKQVSALSNRPSSSVVRDYAELHSMPMSDDDDDASRPLKKQRLTPPRELSRRRVVPFRLEKRASSGAVYFTNKPKSPIELFSGSSSYVKKTVGIQVADDGQVVLHKQLDLVLAENDGLKVANDVLKKEREKLEDEISYLQERNEALTTMAQGYHAQYHEMDDSYYIHQQELLNPFSASALLDIHQEANSPQGSHTYDLSCTEDLPTDPHVLAGLFDEPSSAALGTQGYDTDHALQIGVQCSFADPSCTIQDISQSSRHQLEKDDSTMQQPSAPSEGNSPVEVLAADPTAAQSIPSTSVGNLPSPLGTKISFTLSRGYSNSTNHNSIISD